MFVCCLICVNAKNEKQMDSSANFMPSIVANRVSNSDESNNNIGNDVQMSNENNESNSNNSYDDRKDSNSINSINNVDNIDNLDNLINNNNNIHNRNNRNNYSYNMNVNGSNNQNISQMQELEQSNESICNNNNENSDSNVNKNPKSRSSSKSGKFTMKQGVKDFIVSKAYEYEYYQTNDRSKQKEIRANIKNALILAQEYANAENCTDYQIKT